MANVSRVQGFRPVKHMNGSPYNGQFNLYYVPSTDGTAMGVGDLVKLAGSASADGYATVAQAAATNPVCGAVVGFVVDPANLNSPQGYRTASTNRYVMVADSPDLVFECQEDAVGGALAVTSVGLNAEVVVAAASSTTGFSGMQLDTSTVGTTSTIVLKVIGFPNRVDNEIGVANAKVWVTINNHQLGSLGSTGV